MINVDRPEAMSICTAQKSDDDHLGQSLRFHRENEVDEDHLLNVYFQG